MEDHDKNLADLIRTATNEVLEERGLSEHWCVMMFIPKLTPIILWWAWVRRLSQRNAQSTLRFASMQMR